MKKTKIALLTQWFDPEPTFKGLLFAKGLSNKNFDVIVVTGFPNYPGGNVYTGYKIQIYKKEVIDNIKIIRLPLYPSHSRSIIGRVLNYLSFCFSSLIYTIFFMPKVDVIYGYHPPLTIGIVLSLVRVFRKIPVVYDIQDLWPDSLKATGMFSSELGLKIVSIFCNWVYSKVDVITVLSLGFKEKLIERGVNKNKIQIIYNWCNEEKILKKNYTKPQELKSISGLILMFAGNIGPAQSLENILLAFKSLKKDLFHFVIIGTGIDLDKLKKLKIKENLSNVTFLPPVKMEEISNYLKFSDLLLVHLKNDPLFEITIPSKIQAYMAIGKPLLVGVKGNVSEIVEKNDLGISFEPGNANQFVNSLKIFSKYDSNRKNTLSKNSKNYYESNMSFKIGLDKFSKIFTLLSKVK